MESTTKAQQTNSTKAGQENNNGTCFSTISKVHYTLLGEHPEDRIYGDKEHIQKLYTYITSIICGLADSLRLTLSGEKILIDYLNDARDILFEEYLEEKNLKYVDLVCENNHYIRNK
jgi:hypothetical protein